MSPFFITWQGIKRVWTVSTPRHFPVAYIAYKTTSETMYLFDHTCCSGDTLKTIK